MEKVFVGSKELSKYITSCFFALGKADQILIVSRGRNIKTALDVLAIMIRDYLDNPKYNVVVGSEDFDERKVTTVEITLSGTKREEIKNNK